MLFKKSRTLQKENQVLINKIRQLKWSLVDLQKELEDVKKSGSNWKEKAHSYRRQRSYLARQIQTQGESS